MWEKPKFYLPILCMYLMHIILIKYNDLPFDLLTLSIPENENEDKNYTCERFRNTAIA